MIAGTFAAPFVATYGATDPTAPLVVLLHGRGSNEQEILGLAAHLPAGPEYAAVRAPIAEGGGYAWFANRGIGRPVAESLRSTMNWFRTWLDDIAPAGRPVLLVGFSGGAAFAGGLVLDEPSRYAGAAILYGTLPFGAGLATDPGHLANLPVFVAQGDGDHVIPRELLDRTWTYLLSESGAPTVAQRQPGGHQLTTDTAHQLADWIAHRLTLVARHGATPAGPRPQAAWPTVDGRELPQRPGPRPERLELLRDQLGAVALAADHDRVRERPGGLVLELLHHPPHGDVAGRHGLGALDLARLELVGVPHVEDLGHCSCRDLVEQLERGDGVCHVAQLPIKGVSAPGVLLYAQVRM